MKVSKIADKIELSSANLKTEKTTETASIEKMSIDSKSNKSDSSDMVNYSKSHIDLIESLVESIKTELEKLKGAANRSSTTSASVTSTPHSKTSEFQNENTSMPIQKRSMSCDDINVSVSQKRVSPEEAESLNSAVCHCESHTGKLVINREYGLTVEEIKNMIFTEGELTDKFWKYRKLRDVQTSNWTNGTKTLECSLNFGPFGSGRSYEEIKILRESKNQYIVIESDCDTRGVLYCDYFIVRVRYCITRINARASRLRVDEQIVFKKHPNFILKAFIEKNSHNVMRDVFGHLEKLILEQQVTQADLPAPYDCCFESLPAQVNQSQLDSSKDTSNPGDIVSQAQSQDDVLGKQEKPKPNEAKHQPTLAQVNQVGSNNRIWVKQQEPIEEPKPKSLTWLIVILTMFCLVLFFNARIYTKLSNSENLVKKTLENSKNCWCGYHDSHVATNKEHQKKSLLLVKKTLDELESSLDTNANNRRT